MSTTDVLDWLVENGPATRREIVENSGLSETQVIKNLQKMSKWEAYYKIIIDESGNKHIYDAEKTEVDNRKGFSKRI